MNKSKNILVVGGAGFIGSSLILSLQDKYRIISLDRSDNGRFKKYVNNSVDFVKGDVCDKELLNKLALEVDLIIYLAGGGGNSACLNDPIWAVNAHFRGLLHLIKVAQKSGIRKIIFSSSCFVYNDSKNKDTPIKEETICEPISFYGTLKRTAEDLICSSGIDFNVLRLANVYGNTKFYPLQNCGVVNNFIRAGINKEKMYIYGTGRQGIDYIHIQDIINAIKLVVENNFEKQIYNIGSGKLVSIAKLADITASIFKDEFGRQVEIKEIANSPQQTHSTPLMSIEKIKKDFGWQPEIDLKTGIKQIIFNNIK